MYSNFLNYAFVRECPPQIMNKTILFGIAIAVAFVVGVLSANPVVQAVGGWQAAVDDLQSQIDAISGTQVYEISGVSVIPEGEIEGPTYSIFCEDGDWLETSSSIVITSVEQSIDGLPFTVFSFRTVILDDETPNVEPSKAIGLEVTPKITPTDQEAPFDLTVTTTGLCLSPSS